MYISSLTVTYVPIKSVGAPTLRGHWKVQVTKNSKLANQNQQLSHDTTACKKKTMLGIGSFDYVCG